MPRHEFIVGGETQRNIFWSGDKLYENGSELSLYASLDDELFDYVSDTLTWIRATHPDGNIRSGLNYYGYSIITEQQDLLLLRNVIRSWMNLFEQGPEEIELTGRFSWKDDKASNGNYEKNTFQRHDIIHQFSLIIQVVDSALESEQSVIHYGI
ncbi:hypothetical protein [Paenibacillus massiliensis]|uniref:hypothetical protein n=1 Tax=Paenibacillus massiliensis TaxID=225917 RepID=UPI000416B241|nr:hypothetical protein [Paenibacillus massiliensis]